jgi:hypothetical protein
MSTKEKLISTFFWGFVLWLIGYSAGIILFFIVPKGYIGWGITPFATVITIWVLIKKIKRPELTCYFGLGLMWTLVAVILDYIFLVRLLNTESAYYKPDVFLYYILTFTLPIIVGYWKYTHKSKKTVLF